MQTYQPPAEPGIPESIPLYLRECWTCDGAHPHEQDKSERNQYESCGTIAEQKAAHVGEDQLVFLNLTAKVCICCLSLKLIPAHIIHVCLW